MAWLSDVWRKLNEVALVEKDDVLYQATNWGITWGGGYAVLQLPNLLFALIISRWLGYASWVGILLLFALLAVLTGLVVLIGYRIERHRFPLGRPLVWIDQDTLTLRVIYAGFRPAWPLNIRVPLPTLRRITIRTESPRGVYFYFYSMRFTFSDRDEKLVSFPHANPAVINFLRRKLPPSIQLTVDNEPPLFGRGGL